jgi:hypothetical protein
VSCNDAESLSIWCASGSCKGCWNWTCDEPPAGIRGADVDGVSRCRRVMHGTSAASSSAALSIQAIFSHWRSRPTLFHGPCAVRPRGIKHSREARECSPAPRSEDLTPEKLGPGGLPRQAADGRRRQTADGRRRQTADWLWRQAADGRRRQAADGRRGQAADGRRRQAADGRRRQAADGRRGQAADGRRGQAADGRRTGYGAADLRPRGESERIGTDRNETLHCLDSIVMADRQLPPQAEP